MDLKGKEITPEERKIIIKLRNEDKTLREIGKIVGRTHSSIQRVINNYTSSKSIISKPRSGRPSKLTAREKRYVFKHTLATEAEGTQCCWPFPLFFLFGDKASFPRSLIKPKRELIVALFPVFVINHTFERNPLFAGSPLNAFCVLMKDEGYSLIALMSVAREFFGPSEKL
ncbi:uncharacterized protein CDAR_263481 [Caerostris darwini]|uniref:Transposase IS30-like HTH domain-containing protein n=1 Tax=Caerostris darwini TaxID=1538125 RepID=A0AAV4RZE8_9ARAC|nr:uncharacterized protein CDAR_263481 [Caerostris darwini]